jgi:hypothetical protein
MAVKWFPPVLAVSLALAGCAGMAAPKPAQHAHAVVCNDADTDNLADETTDGPPGCVDGNPLLIPYSQT